MDRLKEIKLPFTEDWLPDGFLNLQKINILYQLAYNASSVLEIGSWVGRSTCVIAKAIKIRSEADALKPTPFYTIDYFIENDAEWEKRFGVPLASKKNAEVYRRYMRQPGGSRAELEKNLSDRELDKFVSIFSGDFLEVDFGRKFGMIFCDATHDQREIDMNLPHILKLLEPGGILVCDDIKNDSLESMLRAHTDFKWGFRDAGVFYGEPK